MALNGDNCGDELQTAFDALTDAERADPVILYRTLCGVLFDHIAANAEVTVTVAASAEPVGDSSDVDATGGVQ